MSYNLDMVSYFTSPTQGKGFIRIDEPQKNCWVHLEAPSAEEILAVSELTAIPCEFLNSALDEEEAAHLDNEDGAKLFVIDIPKMTDAGIFTMPLAICHNTNYFVTVCLMPTSVIEDFFKGKIKNADLSSYSKLLYQILNNNFSRFLYYLKQIDKTSNLIQRSLSKSMQNKELLELLDLQKSLVFFSASLTANNSVAQRLANANLSKSSEEERDILEDVLIESKQALEMCSVYREIIKSTMDAFASVVNNNQNIVMKFLTAVTIILSIPMVISGFWGMNTGVPFENSLLGFVITVGISIVASVVIAIIMWRKKMF